MANEPAPYQALDLWTGPWRLTRLERHFGIAHVPDSRTSFLVPKQDGTSAITLTLYDDERQQQIVATFRQVAPGADWRCAAHGYVVSDAIMLAAIARSLATWRAAARQAFP